MSYGASGARRRGRQRQLHGHRQRVLFVSATLPAPPLPGRLRVRLRARSTVCQLPAPATPAAPAAASAAPGRPRARAPRHRSRPRRRPPPTGSPRRATSRRPWRSRRLKLVKRLVGVIAPDRSDIASVSYALAKRVGTLCSFRRRTGRSPPRPRAPSRSGFRRPAGLLARDPLEAARRRALARVLARDRRRGQRRVALRVADLLHRRAVIAAALAAAGSSRPPRRPSIGRRVGAARCSWRRSRRGASSESRPTRCSRWSPPASSRGPTSRGSAHWCPRARRPPARPRRRRWRPLRQERSPLLRGHRSRRPDSLGYGEGVTARGLRRRPRDQALAGADEPVPRRADRAAPPAGTGRLWPLPRGRRARRCRYDGLALMALRAAGAPRRDPAVRGAVRWLLAQRLPGAGWAGAAGSSTVSNSTGLALRGLSAAGVGWPVGAAPALAGCRAATAASTRPGCPGQSPARDARLGSGAYGRPLPLVSGRHPAALQVAILIRAGQATAGVPATGARGKSGHRRAGCWVTPRRGNPTESATERTPPKRPARVDGKGEKVR